MSRNCGCGYITTQCWAYGGQFKKTTHSGCSGMKYEKDSSKLGASKKYYRQALEDMTASTCQNTTITLLLLLLEAAAGNVKPLNKNNIKLKLEAYTAYLKMNY